MKAFLSRKYGSPDVFELEEVERPTPGESQVLVRIRALALNPFEWHHLRGTPRMMRLSSGLFRPKHEILGGDLAGTVEAVGAGVTRLKPGDAVYGFAGFGAFAEFACASENSMALKPDELSFEEAAAVPLAALTALQCLRTKGGIRSEHRVLINGASGGVGTFAVQIARSFDTEVTGVCSTGNLDLVRSIGADYVIDYKREDFTRTGRRYDLIVDAVGNRGVPAYLRALADGGTCIVAGFTGFRLLAQIPLLAPWAASG